MLKREWKATSNRTLLPFFWASILLYKLIRAEIRKLFWKKKDFVYIPILTSIFYICLMSKRKQHIRQCIYLLAFLHICCSFTSYALSVMNSLDDRSKPSPRTHTCMSFSCFLLIITVMEWQISHLIYAKALHSSAEHEYICAGRHWQERKQLDMAFCFAI